MADFPKDDSTDALHLAIAAQNESLLLTTDIKLA